MSDKPVEIAFTPHPTDSLLVCEVCNESLASDNIKDLADFVQIHQRKHSEPV